MRHDEGWLQSDTRQPLYYQRWRPDGNPPRAVVVMLHGAFAHSDWYVSLPRHEVPRGYAVYAYDQRGWGRSPGQRGYMASWREPVEELGSFLGLAQREEGAVPVFLMGHTGSAPFVLDYAARQPQSVRGVFCVSPLVSTSPDVPPSLRATLRALNVVAPRLPINVRRRFEARAPTVSHDPAFRHTFLTDPLANTMVTPRWLVETEKSALQVNVAASKLTVPLLFLLGGEDQNVPAKDYFARVGSPDKTLKEYAGAYTNLLSETCTDAVLTDIDAWLDAHAKS